jgi:hypothetical protein
MNVPNPLDTILGDSHMPSPEPDQGTPPPPPPEVPPGTPPEAPPEGPPDIPPEIIDPPLPHQIEPIRDPLVVPGQEA